MTAALAQPVLGWEYLVVSYRASAAALSRLLPSGLEPPADAEVRFEWRRTLSRPTGSERINSLVTLSSLPTRDTRSSWTSTARFRGVRTRVDASALLPFFDCALAGAANAPKEATNRIAAKTEYNFFITYFLPIRVLLMRGSIGKWLASLSYNSLRLDVTAVVRSQVRTACSKRAGVRIADCRLRIAE